MQKESRRESPSFICLSETTCHFPCFSSGVRIEHVAYVRGVTSDTAGISQCVHVDTNIHMFA